MPQKARSRYGVTAGLCVAVVAGMVGMAYAAVPLYRLFCQVTGYGGTTQVAEKSTGPAGERVFKIRFDANVSSGLGWQFKPVERSIDVHVGENSLAFYSARNLASSPSVGTATFNVTPLSAGQYFNKVDCFCFTEQALAPGESAELPVSFFIDPAIEDDRDLDAVTTITLSYTFFPAASSDDLTALDAAVAPGQANVN